MNKTRYRCSAGSTRDARKRFHNLAKVGRILKVEAVRYTANCKMPSGTYAPITIEAYRFTGTKGTARFTGLCHGYGGEGPHGLRDLLQFAGLKQAHADLVAFQTTRFTDGGTDWTLELDTGNPGNGAVNGYVVLTNRDGKSRGWQRFEALVDTPPCELLNPNR